MDAIASECQCHFTDVNGLTVLDVETPNSNCRISKQGAQLLSWAPTGHEPVFWLSPGARFESGKAIRGGAPICWPWFGAHPATASFPKHGFARTLDWEYVSCKGDNGNTQIVFNFANRDFECHPHRSSISATFTIGTELRIDLTTKNESEYDFSYTQALHSYFQVGDIEAIQVEGLEDKTYIDTLDNDKQCKQSGPITVSSEIDRIYYGANEEINLIDEKLSRRLSISSEGSNSAIVWNPWIEKSADLGDMPEETYRNMICIETANARDDFVVLEAGQSHTLSTTVRVFNL